MEHAPRPRLHFTPRTGRVGDLFGVLAVDGRHHLFYEITVAGEAPAWGWATSDDLIIWSEQGAVPAPGDAHGGSVVAGPVVFCTGADGRITRAVPGPGRTGWRQDVPGPLIPAPPSGVGDMRDPAVWWAGDGWRMLLSGRLRDGSAAVLQYHSADLLTWSYDGVLISKERTGWGSPRLFPLDGSWVLLVSIGDEVAYAIGDYDGLHFTARAWGTFGRGRLGSAVTFADAAGRRCLLARLGDDLAWSGAISLPWVLSVRADRLIATPHPNLDPYLISGATGLTAAGGEVRDHGDLILRMPAGGETTLFADADIVEVTVEGVSGLGVARRTSPAAPGMRFARFGGLG